MDLFKRRSFVEKPKKRKTFCSSVALPTDIYKAALKVALEEDISYNKYVKRLILAASIVTGKQMISF